MQAVIDIVAELVAVKALDSQGITCHRALLALLGGFILDHSSRHRLFLDYLLWGI
jgi:hypothetical protein